ncbi:MAG: hypothetical protein NVS3B18_05450 [Candidatus Dormibacteria bacterium]
MVAPLALVVAMTGTGYAALRIAAGSVGTAKLKDGAVTAQKVKLHTLLASDFRPGPLRGGTGGSSSSPAGANGQTGPAGPAGPVGPTGTARAYGLVSVPTGGAPPTLSRSHEIASVTQGVSAGVLLTGVSCITPAAGINPATTTVVVTPDENGAGTSREIGHIDSSAVDCPVGSFEIEMRHLEISTATPYTVIAHHGGSGFSFVIP